MFLSYKSCIKYKICSNKLEPTLSLLSPVYLLFTLKHWWQLYKWQLSVFLHQRHLLGWREKPNSFNLFILNIEISNDLHFCTKNVVLCTLALLKRLWQLAHNIQKIFSLAENISYLARWAAEFLSRPEKCCFWGFDSLESRNQCVVLMLFYRALKVRSLFLRNILEFYCVISYVANDSEVILLLQYLL